MGADIPGTPRDKDVGQTRPSAKLLRCLLGIHDIAEKSPQIVAQILPRQRESDGRLQEARFRTAVKALTVETEPIHLFTAVPCVGDRISQLDLAPGAGP